MKDTEKLQNFPNSQLGIKLKKMLNDKIALYSSHPKQLEFPIVNSTKNSFDRSKCGIAKSESGHYNESKKSSYSTIDQEHSKNNITLSNKEMLQEIYGTFNTIQPGRRMSNNRYKKELKKTLMNISPVARADNISLIAKYKDNALNVKEEMTSMSVRSTV